MSTVKFILLTVLIIAAYAIGYFRGKGDMIDEIINIIESIRDEKSSSRKDA